MNMWQKLYEITNLLFNFGKDVQQNRTDIAQLQAEVRQLTATTHDEFGKMREAIQRLAYEVQRVQENDAHEREKMEFRLEIQRLNSQKQLPRNDPDAGRSEEQAMD